MTLVDTSVASLNLSLPLAYTFTGAAPRSVSVLAESGNDRKGPFFRRFFPVAPSELVRRPLRKQAEHTITVMAVELGKLDKKRIRAEHAERYAE